MNTMEPARITINGVTYRAESAQIESTTLGFEDHGCAIAMLHVDYGGSGQGIGGNALDEYVGERGEGERLGTAFGMEYALSILKVVGVKSWEKLPGAWLYVLKTEDRGGWGSDGIANIKDPRNRYLIFDDLVNKYYPERKD